MAKILYSPGFGAGWTTWADGTKEFQYFMLTYQPIIDAIERGEKMSEAHPAVVQFVQDAASKFGMEYIYLGGAEDLRVREVKGLIRITEYDGNEGIEFKDDAEYFFVP
jgi:hypothetical protein